MADPKVVARKYAMLNERQKKTKFLQTLPQNPGHVRTLGGRSLSDPTLKGVLPTPGPAVWKTEVAGKTSGTAGASGLPAVEITAGGGQQTPSAPEPDSTLPARKFKRSSALGVGKKEPAAEQTDPWIRVPTRPIGPNQSGERRKEINQVTRQPTCVVTAETMTDAWDGLPLPRKKGGILPGKRISSRIPCCSGSHRLSVCRAPTHKDDATQTDKSLWSAEGWAKLLEYVESGQRPGTVTPLYFITAKTQNQKTELTNFQAKPEPMEVTRPSGKVNLANEEPRPEGSGNSPPMKIQKQKSLLPPQRFRPPSLQKPLTFYWTDTEPSISWTHKVSLTKELSRKLGGIHLSPQETRRKTKEECLRLRIASRKNLGTGKTEEQRPTKEEEETGQGPTKEEKTGQRPTKGEKETGQGPTKEEKKAGQGPTKVEKKSGQRPTKEEKETVQGPTKRRMKM